MSNPLDLFNSATAQDPNAGKTTFDDAPLPEGIYPLVVTAIVDRKYIDGVSRKPEDVAAACASDPSLIPGDEISMTFEVTEGKYAKRKIFANFCTKPSSNQKTYGDFTPEKKMEAGIQDLCGLRLRFGTPAQWTDWLGKMANMYVTAKKDKNGKIRNNLRCTVKPGEENAPRPSAPANTTAHASDEIPF